MCTIHRAENVDNVKNLQEIFAALETISCTQPVVIPLHPHTRLKLSAINYDFEKSKIHFIPPVGYLEMIWLLKNCRMAITDSGGLQKESCFFNKFCVILRDETEWVELVEKQASILAGTSYKNIVQCVEDGLQHHHSAIDQHLFGDGTDGSRIIEILAREQFG